jgi:hypothetical protein
MISISGFSLSETLGYSTGFDSSYSRSWKACFATWRWRYCMTLILKGDSVKIASEVGVVACHY